MTSACPETVEAITARLREIKAPWCARIIEIDHGLNRIDDAVEDPTPRQEKIRALRELANLLDENPELECALHMHLSHYVYGGGPEEILEKMRAIRRIYGGTFEKRYSDESSLFPQFQLTGQWGAYTVDIWAQRESVCERVQVGVKTATVARKDPDAVAEATAMIPEELVTIEEPIMEWHCPEGV